MLIDELAISKGGIALFLAPMAGFSDSEFRSICKECGADVLVSEFVMANAVLEAGDDSRVWQTLYFPESQRPMGIQIFGADPALMAQAARKVEERLAPDFIDINMGCPAPKVVCQNAGSALLKDLPLASEIVRSVSNAVRHTPVTAKIRIGWDENSIVALDAARRLQDAGAQMLTVHGRTRQQGYSGDADWELIARIASGLDIPVVGNGAVGGDYTRERILSSGVAGAMVGRAALGNPWIFSRLRSELDGKSGFTMPSIEERMRTMLRYARVLIEKHGEALSSIRAKLKPFVTGTPGARKMRREMDAIGNYPELEAFILSQTRD